MFKQIMAIVFLNILEFGLAFFYFWYVTNNVPLWTYIVVILILGASNIGVLNLYFNGRREEELKEEE